MQFKEIFEFLLKNESLSRLIFSYFLRFMAQFGE